MDLTCHFIKSKKKYLYLKIIKTKKIIIKLISYDEVCEIARTALIKEYIELENHSININIKPIMLKKLKLIKNNLNNKYL